jgi:hypothetical protein
VSVFDLQTMKELAVKFPHHSAPVTSLRFEDQRDVLFAASSDSLSVLQYETGVAHERVPLSLTRLCDVAIAKRNVVLAAADRGTASISRVKFDVLKPFGTAPTTSQETAQYTAIRELSPAFRDEMNTRRQKYNRLASLLGCQGLADTLAQVMRNPADMGEELLSLLVERPAIVKLDHADLIIGIAEGLLKSSPTAIPLALTAIDNQMMSFGRLVVDTLVMASQAVGTDIALEERRDKCLKFAHAYMQVQPSVDKCAQLRDRAVADKARSILANGRDLAKLFS